MLEHNRLILGHNMEDFWESIMGKFSSIIDTGLTISNLTT